MLIVNKFWNTLKSDKQLIKERFEASFGQYNRLALVQQRICDLLVRRFEELQPQEIARAIEVGAGTGFLTSKLVENYNETEWYLNDIVPAAETYLQKYLVGVEHHFLWGDAELIEFPNDVDLIASASTVQWFDHLPEFVSKSAKSTKPGGWLLLSTFGKSNFKEILHTTAEGLEYYTIDELVELLSGAEYELMHQEEHEEQLLFDAPLDVLHHIRATGVNSIRKTRWNRKQFNEFADSYRDNFTTIDDKVSLTYHPILLIGRKKQ